MTANLFNFQLL